MDDGINQPLSDPTPERLAEAWARARAAGIPNHKAFLYFNVMQIFTELGLEHPHRDMHDLFENVDDYIKALRAHA